ncbi:CheY-like superfamily [Thamnocephalis sphaerospora]|uniref:CheY-like superfamily n=1 Tax=Thamnocephalis sphaerospora TaxID=78915 RepID=A0A4V1IWC8_9FUNG|nr:CheY-like superfamily [Thamnocephalis sphaerospora]|eukprot:RKP07109.1 CheY-like superfamily [Thamnocephalis sphaerospora]
MVTPPINVLIVEGKCKRSIRIRTGGLPCCGADNPINQTILSTFLRKRKIKYAVASDGREAVEMWKNGDFHLVLMDIQLPVMNGIDATKEIRRMEKERKAACLSPPGSPGEPSPEQRRLTAQKHSPVIIVALTASALQSDRNAALAAGCNDFLTKPVSLLWLEKKIVEWGCMQALINFDGWRRWKRQDSGNGIAGGSLRAGNGAAPAAAPITRSISERRAALPPS